MIEGWRLDLFTYIEPFIGWLALASVLMLLASAVLMPWFVTLLPEDYFLRESRAGAGKGVGPGWLRPVFIVIKNLLGALLALLGLVMFFTPGQGLLTLLVGLVLMDFPGKYRFERWLVLRPGVLPALNWLRRRRDLAPLRSPHAAAGPETDLSPNQADDES